jgi:hypothetical protein
MKKNKNIIILIAATLSSCLVIWTFWERLVGPTGYIAINRTVSEKHSICLHSINEIGLSLKKYKLEVIEKELRHFRSKCGYRPLEGTCLKADEKVYYSKILEEKKDLKEVVRND